MKLIFTEPINPLSLEYLALPQVYTFFRWRLYEDEVLRPPVVALSIISAEHAGGQHV